MELDNGVGPISNYGRQATHYDRGRTLSSDSMEALQGMIRNAVGDRSPRWTLDIGSGTGRFSASLADWLGGGVIAMEISPEMRMQATGKADPRVRQIGGSAMDIPLADESIDVAWLANVFHHLRPPDKAAAEMHRVLQPDGQLLVSNGLREHAHRFPEGQWFPGAVKISQRDMPSEKDIVATLSEAGFLYEGRQTSETVWAKDLHELADKLATRAFSTLQRLPKKEFDRDLDRLRQAAEKHPQRSTEVLQHVLAFRKLPRE